MLFSQTLAAYYYWNVMTFQSWVSSSWIHKFVFGLIKMYNGHGEGTINLIINWFSWFYIFLTSPITFFSIFDFCRSLPETTQTKSSSRIRSAFVCRIWWTRWDLVGPTRWVGFGWTRWVGFGWTVEFGQISSRKLLGGKLLSIFWLSEYFCPKYSNIVYYFDLV